MKRQTNEREQKGKHEHALPQEISADQKKINIAAHDEAMNDIDQDPDLSIHSPNDDLDESESARLGEDRTDLV